MLQCVVIGLYIQLYSLLPWDLSNLGVTDQTKGTKLSNSNDNSSVLFSLLCLMVSV